MLSVITFVLYKVRLFCCINMRVLRKIEFNSEYYDRPVVYLSQKFGNVILYDINGESFTDKVELQQLQIYELKT